MTSYRVLSSLPHRADLQGLRAVAILLVVLAHAGVPWVSGGFVGVDIFLVLSGYLITGLLLREIEQSGNISFFGFYARRLKRLLPAMIVMLGFVFLLAFKVLSDAEAHVQLASSLFATTWTSNLYFSFTEFTYFDELAARDLFIHTWSLAVEEQFYLIWPMLFLLLFRFGLLRQMFRGLGLLFFASLAVSIYWTAYYPLLGFYMMPSRIWQFALGGVIHIVLAHDPVRRRLSGANAWIALSTGVAMIVVSAIALHPNLAYPGIWALAPSLGTALVIAAGQALGGSNPLAHPALGWIGDRSYSLYLWHWPILALGFSLGFQGQPVPTLGLVMLALLFAIFSYRFVEQPFWKGRASHASAQRTILLGLLTMAIALAAFFHGLRNPQQMDEKVAKPDVSTQWRMDLPEIYRMRCDAWYTHAQVEPCVFGSSAANKTVVLLGDSIGAQWFSLVPEIFKQPEWRIIVLTKSACPIVDVDFFYARIGKTYQVCTDWRNAVLKELISLRPDVLIMGNAITNEFSKDEWTEGTSRILGHLSSSVGTIILIPGTPNLGFDGPGCIARQLLPMGQIDRSACIAKDRLHLVEPIKRYLETAAARFKNVHLLDLNDLVCPDGNCNAVSEQGVVVFRDSQHLTDTFVRSKISDVRIRVKKLVSDLH